MRQENATIRKSESRKVQMEQAFPFLINVIKYPGVTFLLRLSFFLKVNRVGKVKNKLVVTCVEMSIFFQN